MPLLTWLLADPSPEIQQMALMIIGNLSSDAIDYNSKTTKAALLKCGGARAVLGCILSDDEGIVLGACGALQNLCFSRDWSELAVRHGIHRNLEALLGHADSLIVRYASGALQNITRSLQIHDLSEYAIEAVKERSLEAEREAWIEARAIRRIARAYRQIPEVKRQARFERAMRRRRRAANVDASDMTESWDWASSSWSASRPSSAASSRSFASHASSHASSYVSARSAPILSF